VLNGTESTQKDTVFFTKTVPSQFDNTCSSSCIRKKKLNASKVKFLKFLGFAVHNFLDD